MFEYHYDYSYCYFFIVLFHYLRTLLNIYNEFLVNLLDFSRKYSIIFERFHLRFD